MDSLENLFPFLDYCESPLWIFVCERERSSVWDKCRREWLLGHMVSVLFSFITNCFPEWPFPLHSHQQCTSDPISLHPCQYLVSSLFFFNFFYHYFLILAILRGVLRYLTAVLIYILLMTNEAEHLFTFIYHLDIIFSAISVLVFLPIFYLGCSFSVEIWDFFWYS